MSPVRCTHCNAPLTAEEAVGRTCPACGTTMPTTSPVVGGHAPPRFNRLQSAGILVFVFLCGWPALEMNGFGS